MDCPSCWAFFAFIRRSLRSRSVVEGAASSVLEQLSSESTNSSRRWPACQPRRLRPPSAICALNGHANPIRCVNAPTVRPRPPHRPMSPTASADTARSAFHRYRMLRRGAGEQLRRGAGEQLRRGAGLCFCPAVFGASDQGFGLRDDRYARGGTRDRRRAGQLWCIWCIRLSGLSIPKSNPPISRCLASGTRRSPSTALSRARS